MAKHSKRYKEISGKVERENYIPLRKLLNLLKSCLQLSLMKLLNCMQN